MTGALWGAIFDARQGDSSVFGGSLVAAREEERERERESSLVVEDVEVQWTSREGELRRGLNRG